MATSQGETCTTEVSSRPLGANCWKDWYWAACRRYHFARSCTCCSSSWAEYVSTTSFISTSEHTLIGCNQGLFLYNIMQCLGLHLCRFPCHACRSQNWWTARATQILQSRRRGYLQTLSVLISSSQLDKSLWYCLIIDSTNLFAGCPVGLQLIGRSQEEEAVIAMTEIVDNALIAFKATPAWV